jgi:hypothetical protein
MKEISELKRQISTNKLIGDTTTVNIQNMTVNNDSPTIKSNWFAQNMKMNDQSVKTPCYDEYYYGSEEEYDYDTASEPEPEPEPPKKKMPSKKNLNHETQLATKKANKKVSMEDI